MGVVGARGTGHVRASGAEAGAGAGDRGVGIRAFVIATVVTRLCARLRSVLRWLTRRLEVPERAVGRGAAAAVWGTQSRYTSMVAKECWGSGLSALRAASGESRVAEAPYGAYLQEPSALRERIEYRGWYCSPCVASTATESEYMRVPRVVIAMGTGDGYFGIERSVVVVARARMSCTDRTAGRATMSLSAACMASTTCGEWPGVGGQSVPSVGRGVPMIVICALRVKMDAAPRRC